MFSRFAPLLFRIAVLGSVLLLLNACEDLDDRGDLSVGITDAPVDNAETLVIEFDGIELQPAEGNRVEIEFEPPKAVDLLALTGGERELLIEDESLEVGSYSSLRLRVNADEDGELDSFITINGAMTELCLGSGADSALLINQSFEIKRREELDFTIDFDLRRSVHQPEDDDCFELQPVLRLIETDNSGSISGIVDSTFLSERSCLPEQGGVVVYVYAGSDTTPDDVDGVSPEPLTSARVILDDAGNFSYRAGFLEPNGYTVALTCEANQDDPEDDDDIQFDAVNNVAVSAGEESTQDF